MQKIQKYSLNRSKKEKILGGRVYHSDFVEISEYRGLIYVTRKTLSLTMLMSMKVSFLFLRGIFRGMEYDGTERT